MAKLLGNAYRLWIDTTTTGGTYAIIAGQQSLTMTRKANTIDTSAKDDFPYATTAAGLFDVGVSLDGIATLPDANGFTLAETSYKAQTTKNFQIRKGGSSGTTGDAVWTAACNILDMSIDYGKNDAVKYKLELGVASAPTTDALS